MHSSLAPSPWMVKWFGLIPRGKVLDLACGQGRHARAIADLGHEVVAVDRDAGALAALAGQARIHTLDVDLEDGTPWPLAGHRFAAVVVANYLYRPLFPAIAAALIPGGVLLYETFMQGNERFGKPSNPEFLLRPGELWEAFDASLRMRAFEQGYQALPKPAMIQRLCATTP